MTSDAGRRCLRRVNTLVHWGLLAAALAVVGCDGTAEMMDGGDTLGGGGNTAGGTNAAGGNTAGGTNAAGGNTAGGFNSAGGTNAAGGNNAGGSNSAGGTNSAGGNNAGGTNAGGNTAGGSNSAGGGNVAGGTNATAGGSSSAGGSSTIDAIIPSSRRTTWNPGIPGGIPSRTTVCTTIDAATYGNGTMNAGSAIQAAIDACPEGQVVQLSAGTFRVGQTLTLTKGVVLRGAGSTNGGHPATTLTRSPAGTVVRMGRVNSTSNASLGTGVNVTQDALQGSTTVIVSNASTFHAGDIVQIDQVDDGSVLSAVPYDCPYFKRAPDRSIGQRIEIASISGNTLTLASPLHWTFRASLQAQVAAPQVAITRYAGLEGVRLTGGNHPYDGAGVDLWNVAYSWVKDVETDTPTGMHIVVSGGYRVVIRDNYSHHSGNYGYGVGCYGIVLRFQSADCLVENNIARQVNKPILFNASGGGNVVAYNYADDSWATTGWQELNIDVHCSYPHMELVEGNEAPHIGASSTHGNAGFLTFFRNRSSAQFHERMGDTGNVAAIQLDVRSNSMNVVGNVLGTAGSNALYEQSSSDGTCSRRHVFLLGSGWNTQGCSFGPSPSTDPAVTTLLRHGNFDFVGNSTRWDSAITARALPDSLYLSGRPSFWPSGQAWPWVGPDRTPMIGTLPAKQRFLAMPP